MVIGVSCPNCGNRYDVAGRLAGRRVRCKGCHSNFRVPVPTHAPQSAKREKADKSGRLDEFFEESESEEIVADSASRPRSGKKSGNSDLGANRAFLSLFLLAEITLVFLSVRGPGSTRFWGALSLGLIGVFGLVSSAAKWDSFRQSRRSKIAASLFGEDGARFVHELAGIALLVVSGMIFCGLIAWPFEPTPVVVEDTLPRVSPKAEPSADPETANPNPPPPNP